MPVSLLPYSLLLLIFQCTRASTTDSAYIGVVVHRRWSIRRHTHCGPVSDAAAFIFFKLWQWPHYLVPWQVRYRYSIATRCTSSRDGTPLRPP